MKLTRTPRFKRQTKKNQAPDKDILREKIKSVLKNPEIGRQLAGDLSGIRVLRFKIRNQTCRLAYLLGEDEVCLLAFGPRENFYRDLKRF